MGFIKKIKTKKMENDRLRALKNVTGNLGEVVEEDNRIVCYVDKKVQGMKKIELFNVNSNRNLLLNKKYDFNKPIYYLLDSLDFDNGNVVELFGYDDVNVVINNCNLSCYFNISGNCTIKNCTFIDSSWLSIYANNLRFSKCNIDFPTDIKVSATKEMYIYDMRINASRDFVTFYSGNKILFDNTKVCSRKILNINSPYINSCDSYFTASRVNISSDKFNAMNIEALGIVCNESKIGKGKMIVSKEVTSLSSERDRLIDVLKQSYNKCKSFNDKEIEDFSCSINSRPVSKVLKRHE